MARGKNKEPNFNILNCLAKNHFKIDYVSLYTDGEELDISFIRHSGRSKENKSSAPTSWSNFFYSCQIIAFVPGLANLPRLGNSGSATGDTYMIVLQLYNKLEIN